MKFLKYTFKRIFSLNISSTVIVLISIIGRIIQQIHFTDVTGDKIFQIQATKNLLEGNGYTFLQAMPSDLSSAVYTPLIKWPPGYSILLSPFYSVFKENLFWGSLGLDILTCISFIWLSRKIIRLFNVPLYAINLYTIITGFYIYTFCSASMSDLITLVFYLSAVYLTLRLLLSSEKKLSLTLVITFILFCCSVLRYMFIPVVFVIPLYLVANGWVNKNKLLLNRGLFILITLIVLEGGVLFAQKQLTGSFAYVSDSAKRFMSGNTLRLDPFLFSSFININLIGVQLEEKAGIPYSKSFLFLQRLHFIPFLLFFVIAVRWLLKKRLKSPGLTDHYISIGVLSSLAILFLLFSLSLIWAPTPGLNKISDWTFVQEDRYFAFVTFFLQQLVIITVFLHSSLFRKWISALLKIVLYILCITTLHGIYYTAKIISKPENIFLYKSKFEILDYSRKLLEQTIRENAGKRIVVYSSDNSLGSYQTVCENVPAVYQKDKLSDLNLRTNNVIVFAMISGIDKDNLNFLQMNFQRDSIGYMRNYYFYSINARSNQPQ